MKRITITLDTCVDVCEHSDRDLVIDRYGDNEEEYFLNMLRKNRIEYEVVEEKGPGGGWPIIEYTGTKEQLIPLMAVMSPYGYDEEEITERLALWDGDENDEDYENVMF